MALARGHDHIHTWEQAAAALGLPAQHGKSIARAVSQRLQGTVPEVHDAIGDYVNSKWPHGDGLIWPRPVVVRA